MEESTIRINKYLANLGICARREVKGLLKGQMVTVNGVRVKEPGTRIDPQKDDIRLNGDRIKPPKMVYYLLNKPKGVVSTTADEFGRKNVTAYVPGEQRVYPVGRLDKDTTGLILLTNNGALTNLLTHPRYHVNKVYRLTIGGLVDQPQLNALRKGVLLEDGITAPAKVTVLKQTHQMAYLEITLHEGRNRQIRRMCEIVGIKLLELDRIKFGPLEKGSLKPGKWRVLTPQEVQSLKSITATK
jgi:23S rRNA pseudouridine2605 synthase